MLQLHAGSRGLPNRDTKGPCSGFLPLTSTPAPSRQAAQNIHDDEAGSVGSGTQGHWAQRQDQSQGLGPRSCERRWPAAGRAGPAQSGSSASPWLEGGVKSQRASTSPFSRGSERTLDVQESASARGPPLFYVTAGETLKTELPSSASAPSVSGWRSKHGAPRPTRSPLPGPHRAPGRQRAGGWSSVTAVRGDRCRRAAAGRG